MSGSSPSAPDPGPTGRRREARLRLRLEVQMITLDGTARMVMADLSRRGARITGLLPTLRRGQQAIIQWNRFEAFGAVVWCQGNQCGLEFDEPLSQRVLLATRQLYDRTPLSSERELTRTTARAFVQGKVRL
ncbi:PilZ domain-containing protein [Novosphingobium piscinae]|uniref:PilZ domain-containing protein n=1 Tax=Novosphingobium piscinae TaxID=1507448 RepID=A0A7X1FXQ2_9SPHN|nr:PilZ domain-containing protein [Novosphingobium piscinae]MBC2668929.1 PilZ domain-containing protein [Novosphingobium piscinae]